MKRPSLLKIKALLMGSVMAFAVPAGEMMALGGGAGWETGGGDLFSLKYVKMGHMLGEEMLAGRPQCAALSQKVDPVKFLQAVEQTHVASVNDTPRYLPHSIQFNRREWYGYSEEEKLHEVFMAYSSLISEKPPQISGKELKGCLPRSSQAKLLGRLDEDHADGSEQFYADFYQASAALKRILLNHSNVFESWSLPTNQLLAIVEEGQNNQIALTATPKALHFRLGEMKDGRNFKDRSSLYLALNQAFWTRIDRAQRVELLFHEYLSLANVDDSRYQYSSQLWKVMPAQMYKEL